MQQTFSSPRLFLNPLSLEDVDFVQEITNSAGWIQFIGERDTKNPEQTRVYIDKIMRNPNIQYWVVSRKEDAIPIGIVSYIKRDYLEHHDIGFALLPAYAGQGYACEAAMTVLENIIKTDAPDVILATTLPDNISSIRLLERMGFHFDREVENENDTLLVYSIAVNMFQA